MVDFTFKNGIKVRVYGGVVDVYDGKRWLSSGPLTPEEIVRRLWAVMTAKKRKEGEE